MPVSFFFDDMPKEVAHPRPSVSDAQVAGDEADHMARRETLELVRAYYRILDDLTLGRIQRRPINEKATAAGWRKNQ